MRFGIGDHFARGQQVDHVLGKWSQEELGSLQERVELAIEMLKSFGFIGLELTMTRYNKAGKSGDNE